MPEKLDIKNWSRKEHFMFYRSFDEPFFGLTFNVEVTEAYAHCKEAGVSFFIYYLYAALKAANQIGEFKHRILGDDVLVYDVVNASPTINRDNGTFGFSYMDFYEDFSVFCSKAQKEIERVRASVALVPSNDASNTIHFSAIPWVQFTSVSHARNYKFEDSIPKISFGKVFDEGNKKRMPVSVHVHHALMDGYHVGLFADYFQKALNNKFRIQD
ncbi:chloramphenicol acetyltransferase [Zhouia spongiae]|uniref:Chloramphenicol acetyltransferase n=1 Tax=Zhouia spongiae TaxID=2202721 RepID=A0ABY3YLX8_9FLAO|nr:chloramphenicol acetyltransferase [Zhouia spongiae]UNY98651.1 chloramphenicol acetyltransferase [Zhouia spongiae]